MKTEEIRALSTEEIRSQLDETREELMNLRFQQATGELVDFTRLRYTRRLIARLLTILGEREKETVKEERETVGEPFVESNKMQKTVVVEVTRTYRHRLYGKVLSNHTRFKAHDELGCQVGDEVSIVESRPISRHKRWVVEEILRGSETALATEEAETEA